jgi:hypothetical protein
MKNKSFLIAGILVLLSIVSITAAVKHYANKPIKMVYYLRDGENRKEVAERFNVKVEDIKIDGRYLMFEVKK